MDAVLAIALCFSFLLQGPASLPLMGIGGKAPGGGGIAQIAHIEAHCSSSPCTSTAIDTTGATLLVVVADGYSAATTLSDSKSNTWQALTTHIAGTQAFETITYVFNPTVGAAHTFTATGGGGFPTIFVTAWSGTLTTSGVFDTQNGATGTSASCQTGSVTPSQTNELIIAGETHSGNSGLGFSIDSGFTIIDTQTDGASFTAGADAKLIPATTSAVNPTWTITGGGNPSVCSIATFKHP